MTINELAAILNKAIESGHGDGPIYFDTDARKFDYHLVAVDSAHYEFEEELYSIISHNKPFILLTTRD